MTTYYLLDGRKISLREYRRVAPNVVVFLLIAFFRLVGFPLGNGALVPLIDRLAELDWDDLPDDARAALADPVGGWERLGFRRVCAIQLPQAQKARFAAAVLLLAPDRTAHVHVLYVRRPDAVFAASTVYSLFGDGTLGMTTNQKHELDDAPTVMRSQLPPGTPPPAVWDRHRENLAGAWAGWEVERLDPEGVRVTAVEVERREVAFHVGRGVLVPATDADYDRLADNDPD